jgi:hypothetical protein
MQGKTIRVVTIKRLGNGVLETIFKMTDGTVYVIGHDNDSHSDYIHLENTSENTSENTIGDVDDDYQDDDYQDDDYQDDDHIMYQLEEQMKELQLTDDDHIMYQLEEQMKELQLTDDDHIMYQLE